MVWESNYGQPPQPPWLRSGRVIEVLSRLASLRGAPRYYDSTYRDITVIDRGNDFDAVSDVFTLAHEYVHGLQDAELGLTELRGRYSYDDDTLIALSNLIEGEAQLRAELALGVLRGETPIPAAIQNHFVYQTPYFRRQIVAASAPYTLAKGSLHYGTGGSGAGSKHPAAPSSETRRTTRGCPWFLRCDSGEDAASRSASRRRRTC